MTTFKVLRAGIQATVQDAGRPGYRTLGVPGSGALDTVALHLVNALVGNHANCAALEMLYSGISLEVAGGTARIAVSGAAATIDRAGTGAIALPAWHSVLLQSGDRLRIATPADTAAGYLAVEGGFAVPNVLGSASTYVQGGLGGYDGRALRAGDSLTPAGPRALSRDERRYATPPSLTQPVALRVIPGPQTTHFAGDALDCLLSQQYHVTPASNRSGLRLEGPVLRHRAGHDLLSEGVATGSIQVPGSGQPVILLADHPTVGGYPKIATVISADWPAAGRLRIGSPVRFALADETAAAAARRAQQEWIAELVAAMETVGA
jgi:allophanate hydrolase